MQMVQITGETRKTTSSAMNTMHMNQRSDQKVSIATQFPLDPYHQRQAQQPNQNLAAQQAAFTTQETGQRNVKLNNRPIVLMTLLFMNVTGII